MGPTPQFEGHKQSIWIYFVSAARMVTCHNCYCGLLACDAIYLCSLALFKKCGKFRMRVNYKR